LAIGIWLKVLLPDFYFITINIKDEKNYSLRAKENHRRRALWQAVL